MKNLIIKVLNARPEEVPSVKLMLYLGFSLGIFLAAYDVAAPAIFLNYFKDQTVLAQAFLVSGFIGVVVTYIYSFLQARISFKVMVYGFIILMLVSTTLIWGLSSFREQQGIVVFAGFVLALPFSYLSLLIFWGYFGRVFNLKQAKRLIGGIDTGQLVASIFALFSFAFVLDRNWLQAVDLFFLSIIGLVGMMASAVYIGATSQLITKREGSVKDRTMSFPKLFRNKYTRLMTFFVIISLMCLTFIDYSFLNVINIQWDTEAEKASFLASFSATIVIFSFLFQTFVTDWIIENYGLKVSLLINPFLSLVLALGAILTGFFFGFVKSPESDIIWFFLAVAAAKLFIDSLKDALDGPAFKLYFLPINSAIKFDVNTKIEGFITALGSLVAGGLLILMNQLHLSLIYILIGVVPILLLWFFITQRMYGGYKSTLEKALEDGKASKKLSLATGGEDNKAGGDDINQLNNLKLLEKTAPLTFEKQIIKIANTEDGDIKDYAQKKIDRLDLNFEKNSATAEGVRAIRELANEAANSADKSDVISISADRLYNLAKSYEKEDRILAAKLLRSLVNDSNIFVLLELLRDPNNDVRHQAIITSRKIDRTETWPLLIELLNNQTFTYEATSALIAAGEKVLPVLDNAFYRSGQTQAVMLKIINIMVEIGGPEAHTMLWQKIDFPDRKIVKQILTALSNKNYKANAKEELVIRDILYHEIGKALWNITAKTELSDAEFNNPLQNALDEEIKSNFDFIYMLMAIVYDRESVALVKENLELGTTEGNAFAIELMDLFIAKDLKPRIFPLVDDIAAKEKLDKLQVFYPRQLYEEQDTYHYLLNRESNNVNRWTKACTLYAIANNESFEIDDSIVAHMFNPDPLLAEIATWITYKNKPAQYKSVLNRMVHKREVMEKIIYRIENKQPLVFDTVISLRKMPEFKGFTGLLLSQIVSQMHTVRLKQDEVLSLNKYNNSVYVILRGATVTTIGNENFKNPDDSNVMSALFGDWEETTMTTKATKPTILLGISLNRIFDILTNYPTWVNKFVTYVSHQYTKTKIST